MAPVLQRSQTLEALLAPAIVVPTYIFINYLTPILNIGGTFSVIYLRFKVAEEIPHHRIIVTVTLTRYGMSTP